MIRPQLLVQALMLNQIRNPSAERRRDHRHRGRGRGLRLQVAMLLMLLWSVAGVGEVVRVCGCWVIFEVMMWHQHLANAAVDSLYLR